MVVDADPGLTGALHDGALGDEALQNLLAELLHRGKFDLRAAQIDRDRVDALLEFGLGDHLVVHDGDDAVEVGLKRRGGRGFDAPGGRLIHDGSRLSGSGAERRENEGECLELIHSSRKDRTSRGWSHAFDKP